MQLFNKATKGCFTNIILTLLFYCNLLLLFAPRSSLAADIGKNSSNGHIEYNVVMIIVSALRSAHLGCYGYSRNTSPNIDRLAQDGISFDQAIAQSYWSLPSLVSIFTSKFVCAHQVNTRNKKLGEGEKTLAEILNSHGYATAAFVCGLDTSTEYGLDKGFDAYDVYSGDDAVGSLSNMVPRAIRWLNENKNKNFFLFLHSYDVHPPYKCSDENSFDRDYKGIINSMRLDYSTLKRINGGVLHLEGQDISLGAEDMNHIISRYDDGIRRADRFIGRLIDELKRLKLYDKTIIVLCADHGEELGERGTFNRFGNQNLYQEVIRVPLIIKYPSLQLTGRRIRSLVALVDLTPTLLDLLDIPQDHDLQGVSMVPLIRTDTALHRYVCSEASKGKWSILRDDGWKLLYTPQKRELYNINDDPSEGNNLSGRELDVEVSLMKEFFLWRERHKKNKREDNYIELNAQLIEKLKKAGYW
jgi:arylsulfatase A-like enzyme